MHIVYPPLMERLEENYFKKNYNNRLFCCLRWGLSVNLYDLISDAVRKQTLLNLITFILECCFLKKLAKEELKDIPDLPLKKKSVKYLF